MNILLLVVFLATWFLIYYHQQSDNRAKLRKRTKSNLRVLKFFNV
jgi:hypothetical protein